MRAMNAVRRGRTIKKFGGRRAASSAAPGRSVSRTCLARKGSNTQMHIHRCMGSKTISLEDSAYERLLAAKRAGESFSDVVHRVLGGHDPSFLDFQGLVDRKSADRLAEAVDQPLEIQEGR